MQITKPVEAIKFLRPLEKITRSTKTVRTSAKACLTSVTIRIRIPDSDHHQNLIICSFANLT